MYDEHVGCMISMLDVWWTFRMHGKKYGEPYVWWAFLIHDEHVEPTMSNFSVWDLISSNDNSCPDTSIR